MTEHVTLEVLSMEVCFGAVRARKFAVGVLLRDLSFGRGGPRSWRSRSTRRARQYSPTALRTNDVSGLVTLLQQRGLSHHGALRVGRVQTALWHDATSGHRSQNRWNAATWRWSRSNWLRVS